MDENKEIELDLKKIFEMLKQKLVYIILVTIIGGILSGCITNFFITPQYTATVKLYAWSNSDTMFQNTNSLTTNEFEASQMLINTYLVVIQSDTFIEKVVDQLGNDISASQVKGMLSCSAIEETNTFRISVTGSDPQQAAEIANVVADVCPDELVRILKVGGVEIIDYAKTPSNPSSPNVKKNLLIGAAAGFIISFAIFFLKDLFDTSINDEDDLKKTFNIPVIGTVPRLMPVTEKNRSTSDNDFLTPPQPVVTGSSSVIEKEEK